MQNESFALMAWRQIGVHTKMACGAREARTTSESHLQFRVTSLPMRFVQVEFLPGKDLYTVTYFRLKRGTFQKITLEKFDGVFAEDLSETIYHMVNK